MIQSKINFYQKTHFFPKLHVLRNWSIIQTLYQLSYPWSPMAVTGKPFKRQWQFWCHWIANKDLLMLHTKVARYSTVIFSHVKNIINLPWIVQWFCKTLKKQVSRKTPARPCIQKTPAPCQKSISPKNCVQAAFWVIIFSFFWGDKLVIFVF